VKALRQGFAVLAAVALLGPTEASAKNTTLDAAPPTGDRGGLALLGRVHHAYADVPAVAVSGRAGTLSFRFSVVLHSGIVIAEQFVGRESSRVTSLVARRGGPTFAREPGASCWRALRSSDPQAFENIGLHFPDQNAMKVLAPQTTSTGWLLPVVIDGGPGAFTIDRGSIRVRSISVGAGGQRILEHVTVLQAVPRLSRVEPRC
jgi:hypothetical protein